jgi:hypothetical protein
MGKRCQVGHDQIKEEACLLIGDELVEFIVRTYGLISLIPSVFFALPAQQRIKFAQARR